MKKGIFNSRRFKHGSLATVITVGFIALIIIANVVVSLLLDRFPLTIDLTSEKRFELTDESVEYVKKLDKDIKITVCADETQFETVNDLYKQAYEIINNYAKYNDNIKIEFVDLQKEPTFAQKYPEEKLQTGNIIIESDLRSKVINSSDLFIVEQNQYGDVRYSSAAEQTLTAGIMYVADEEQVTVSVLGGMSGADVSQYMDLLKDNNYQVVEQNFVTEPLNQEADLVILPAPKIDLTAEQVKQLNAYLDNDGKFQKELIFIASKDCPIQPVLKNFLAEWGIEVEQSLIFETNAENVIYNNNFAMINKITANDVLEQLKSKELPLIVANASPVKPLFEDRDNRKTAVYAATSDTTIAVPYNADESFDLDAQEKKSFATIVKGYREKYIEADLVSSSVVAFGSDIMFYQEFLLNAGFANGDLVMTLTNEMTEKKDAVNIIPVMFANDAITISQGQATTYTIVFVYVLPALLLVIGIVIWVRRRHL